MALTDIGQIEIFNKHSWNYIHNPKEVLEAFHLPCLSQLKLDGHLEEIMLDHFCKNMYVYMCVSVNAHMLLVYKSIEN